MRALSANEAHAIRGKRISMIFQDPQTSLNPLMTVEDQLVETIQAHDDISSRNALAQAVDLLEEIGIENAAIRIKSYPHQFSGGMRQRIAVARALLARPRFLICDEPTSALDVSVQAEILNLLKDLQSRLRLTILFISHNLSVVRQMADDMVVLRNGRIEEQGRTEDLFEHPEAEYTKNLLSLTPVMPNEWRSRPWGIGDIMRI